MLKRLTQNVIEVSEGLSALNLQTAPEFWPILQGGGEAIDLLRLFPGIGLLWYDVLCTRCGKQHRLERRTELAIVDGKSIPLHACIVGDDLDPVVPRIAARLRQAGIGRGNGLMRIDPFVTGGLEHVKEQVGQFPVLALDVLLATPLNRFVFQAEVAAFPVLDRHQNTVVATDAVGAIPVAELEDRDLAGERTQR